METPNVKTIEDIVNFLDINITKTVKTLVYKIDGEIYFILVNGARELNEVKLGKLLKASSLEMATDEDLKKVTDGTFGSLGPVGVDVKIIADNEVLNMSNLFAELIRQDIII